jgi:hypothetical protein
MAHDVFISYAAEDVQVAEQICQTLEEESIKCWMAPRDVPFGVPYEQAILDAIEDSQFLVLIFSAHANASQHVEREIRKSFADRSKTQVFPFRIENVPYNNVLYYYLGGAQWLDASSPPLEEHLRRLVEHVHTHLPRVPEPDATPPPEQKPAPAPPAPPASATPPQPGVPASEPPSLAPAQPEPQMVATVNKPAATTEAAPASVGKSVNGAQPKWEGLSQAGCVILALAVFALIFSSSFCSGGPDGNANVNSGASVNVGTNANQPSPNANQSGSFTNLNATPTPQSSPTAKASPAPPSSANIFTLPRTDPFIRYELRLTFNRINGLSEVTFEVKDKKVTLGGFVYSEMCKQTAERLAKETDGVTAVNNKIAISRKTPEDITKIICRDK